MLGKRIALRGPHLVLANARHDDRLAFSRFVNLLHDLLREQFAGLRRGHAWMPLAKLVDLLQPCRVVRRLDLFSEDVKHTPRIAHDGHRRAHVLAHLSRVDVYVNDLRLGSEGADLACNAVIEPHADADDEVGLIDGPVVMGLAMHARHAQVQDVVALETADAEQRRHHRNLRALGQLGQFRECAGDDHAVTGEDQRSMRLVDELGGALDVAAVALQSWLVTA